MSASHGRHYLAIPGPSAMPDEVLRAMHRPGPNIYGQHQGDLQAGLLADIKKVACTDKHAAMYIANGHGTWEAALANVLFAGDQVLVLATGRFAHGWASMANKMGIGTRILDFGLRSPIDLQRVTDALSADAEHHYKAVLAVHVDTATSVLNDIRGLRDVMDAENHPALLMVDCIASLGCDRFETDALGVDVMVAACQKGLMTPPGLGFVFFSDRAAQVREKMERVSSYWDWKKRSSPDEFYEYFCGTPPTHLLYGLRAALDMILAEGMESVWQRHSTLARSIHAAVEVWGSEGPMELNIADPQHRSFAVTAVRIGAPLGTSLREWIDDQAGITLGIGLGMADRSDPEWHGFFRIGHMGHVNRQMVMGVLGSIDAGLKTLGIPHGSGALEAASKVLSEPGIQ